MQSKNATPEKYLFSDAERKFVHDRQARAENAAADVRGVLNFIVEREGLEGAWNMAPDNSGIVKVTTNA